MKKKHVLTIQLMSSLPLLSGTSFLRAAQPLHYLITSQSNNPQTGTALKVNSQAVWKWKGQENVLSPPFPTCSHADSRTSVI